MSSATRAEIDESHAQYRGSWRMLALGSPAGEVVERPEVFITACHVSWAMMNAAFLRAPAESEQALSAAVASAARYFSTTKHGWAFVLSDDWLAPSLRERAESILTWYGLKFQPQMNAVGMVAERLAEPVRPLPSLDLRPVKDAWTREAVADINSLCYDVRREIGREAFAVESLYGPDCLGFVGCRDGAPATSAVAMRVDNVAYVALVATLPEHRRVGAAEATIRHALAEARRDWGIERTVLHATDAGLPVYQRMGYRPVTLFRTYMASAPGRAE
ncbi:GNAT family N-acetyltransferase [Pyxidicoccus fallax]|uniref:GNAT family N-acetyltransferase n=1 Tax=Pyxidicoccus fallax TaxID=394095 RepID=A0A848LNV0_9BACT|nr:GNAT family N-acetyltransferase [Pyxidicoccus fallax]NMO19545.1 GNAT family N-acetyltransferase [Pyxidicoccus fallax]NPC80248.1 GNAT family N-acetyltransferase [Pyxidicoccus fallax]